MSLTIGKQAKYWIAIDGLREGILLKGRDAVAQGDFSRWGFWIASAILALLTASVCYFGSGHAEPYSQFITGQITWRAASKAQDYDLLLGLVFGFLLAFVILLLLAGRIRKRIAPTAAIDFHTLIVFASLPAIIWFGRLFLTRDTSLALLSLSALLIVLVLLFALLASMKEFKSENAAHFSDAVSLSVLIMVWSVLSATGLVFAVSRAAILFKFDRRLHYPRFTHYVLVAAMAIGTAFLAWMWSKRAVNEESFTRRLRRSLIVAQGLTPWFFLILLPTPWIKDGRRFFGYPMKPAGWLVIGLLVVIAYLDLARRWRARASSIESYVTSALSPVCLIALLLFIRLDAVGVPTINPDDYHFGEFLLPWWSWSVHHLVPFWDYAPARGLINYVPGFLSSVFFDGMPASFPPAAAFMAAAYLLLCYPVIAKSIGVFPTFLAFLLMPLANGASEIDMLMTAALCILCELYLRVSRSTWLVAWIGIGTLSVLAAPGQGGLLVIATIPLGLFATYHALKAERVRLVKRIGALALTLLLLSLFTPLGKMLLGAIRYGIEQSSVNTVANGIEWSHSWNPASAQVNQWLWESARASWIVVAIVAGVLILRGAVGGQDDRRKRLLAFAIPIFTLMVLFIFRAAGRIDTEGMSRLGIVSIWAVSLLLPILLIAAQGKERRAPVLASCFLLAATLSPYFGAFHTSPDFSPLKLEEFLDRSPEVVEAPLDVVKGSDRDLPNLGNGFISEFSINRLQQIKSVLNVLIDPGETYLDLTNRSTQYFYLGFRPPIDAGAVYNLVNERQQLRAITTIERQPPPVVVASAESIFNDGGTSAYRSHLLYRYLVKRYIPVSINGFIYLVRPDRLARVATVDPQQAIRDESKLPLLDAIFRMEFIDWLPVAWGKSLNTLGPQLRQIRSIGPETQLLLNSIVDSGKGYYQINGQTPSLTFDVSPWNLDGSDAGILTFDFFCWGNKPNPELKLKWNNGATHTYDAMAVRFVAANGPLVVPLDAAPRWLLAKGISSLTFTLGDTTTQCSAFSITHIKLWQRTAVDKLPR